MYLYITPAETADLAGRDRAAADTTL